MFNIAGHRAFDLHIIDYNMWNYWWAPFDWLLLSSVLDRNIPSANGILTECTCNLTFHKKQVSR